MNDLEKYTELEDKINTASSRMNELFEESRAEILQDSIIQQAQIAADNQSYSDITFDGYANLYTYKQMDDIRKTIQSNPQNHEKYNELLDTLYNEIKEGLKPIMERELNTFAYQAVRDDLMEKGKTSPLSEMDDYILDKAGYYAIKSGTEMNHDPYSDYLIACSRAISNLVKNKPLSPEQTKIVMDLGYGAVL